MLNQGGADRRLCVFQPQGENEQASEMSEIHDLEPRIPAARDGKRRLILSPAQERSWVLEQLYPDAALNHLSLTLRLQGTLDWPALTPSLDEILRRHEVLRLAVREVRGRPVPELAPPQPLSVPLEDLTQLPEAERGAHARKLAGAEARQPFKPGRPLLRAKVLRLAPDDHLLIFTLHRIAGDAQSLRILHREWTTLYAACIRGEPSPLPELPMSWFEFARRQRRHLEDKTGEEHLAWWKQQLSGKLPALDLPLDHSRPSIQTFRAATMDFALRSELLEGSTALAGRSEATLEEVLLAAFQALLYRHTGQEDLLMGWPVSGRTRPGSEGIIGPFENTLPLRAHLSGELSFGALVKQVRQATRDAKLRQEAPFETLLNTLHAEHDLSRSPVFQAVFKLEQAPLPPVELPSLSLSIEPVASGASLLDLALSLHERADGLAGKVVFNPDLFEAPTIQRLIGHFETLLQGILADPEQAIARLPLLIEAEQRLLLKDWNQTQAAYPRSKCIHHLFEEQAQRTPDAVALVFEDQQLTYRQLNERADQLAGELRRLGVGPEVRVGICMTRSLEMVVGLYAIHKAGGAYVPMDPAYPLERLAFMLEDAQAPVLLTQQALRELLPASTAKMVFVDAFLETEAPAPGGAEPQPSPEANQSGTVTPDNLAYVIYTSGSTGKPKGVMVRHRNAVNFFTGMDRAIGRGPGVWLAVTSISFDISVLELFWTLTRGFTVVLQGDEATGARLRALRPHPPASRGGDYTGAGQILRHGVTHFQCTPSLAGMMLQDPKTRDALRRVKHFLFGGEPLPPALIGQLAGSGEIFNMYGPTETTVWSTVHPVTRHGGTIAIGRPIANTEIYLLDPQLQPVPIGVPGELFIGGAGVARGYLNRPELTEEGFIRHPFSDDPDARLYRTGDLARYQADGTIEFLGRVDHQVKVRGFRIELGEIEAALRQHPSVRESAVAVWEVGPNDKRLVGYLVARPGPKPKPVELRRFLQGKLPEYMVPSTFVHLDTLPLTPNGKIDRKALPAPEVVRLAAEAGDAPPQTPLEQTIAAVWQELLRVERIGLHDDFFARGGTPLLASEAHARLCEALGMEFPLIKLFQFCTITSLEKYLRDEHPASLPPQPGEQAERQREEPGLRHSATNHQSMSELDQTQEDITIIRKGGRFGGTAPDLAPTTTPGAGVLAPPLAAERESAAKPLPLTEAQREIWYGAQLSDEVSCSFNQSAMLKLRGPLDQSRLEQSFAWLVQRHEALRVTFSPTGEEQRVHAGMPVEIPFVDLSALAPDLRQKELNRQLEQEATTPFDLAKGPLFRVRLVKLGADEHAVLLTLHHIICDGASLGVLLEEWAERYSAAATGGPEAGALELPYSQFVLEQEASLQSPERTEAETFWVEQYSRSAPTLELPADRPRPARRKFTGGSERMLLNHSLTQALKRLSAQHRCTLTTTLLAGFYLLLHRLSGQPEIIIGLPITTRSGQGGEQLVGHCVNFLPLRLCLEGDPTFSEHLSRVWQLLLEAQGYQNFTLGSLLQKLNRPRDSSRMPLASVMFNLDWVDEPVKFAGLRTELMPNPYGFIRFDLSWSVTETDGQLELFSQYSTELFDAKTIQRWFRHYETLLAAIVANPDQHTDQLPRLTLPDGRLEVAAPRTEPAEPGAAPRPAETAAADEAASGPVEETLAQIWREVVLLQEVGRHDNFFDVGGHSLLATKVIARINKAFNVQLSLRAIFEAPTIAELAEAVGQAQTRQPNVSSAITRRARDADAQDLLERLNQISDAELEELLRNPKYKDVLS